MFEEIGPEDVAAWLEQGAVVIDVRESWEFERGHVPGAVNVPMSEITSRLQDVPDNVVLVCASGSRSAHVAGYLTLNGYQKVANLAGGTAGWVEAGFGIELGAPAAD